MLGVGVCGVLAQLCLTSAYKHGQTLVTASLSYSTVAFSCLLAMGLWGERLPFLSYLGITLIALAGIMATAFSAAPPAVRD